jgi:hypothetical protein
LSRPEYSEFESFRADIKITQEWLKKFNNFKRYEYSNPANVRSLPKILYGGYSPGDILSGLFLQVNNKFTLYPSDALSTCHGFNGQGSSSPNSPWLTHKLFNFNSEYNVNVNDARHNIKIENQMAKLRMPPALRIFNYLIYIFLIRFSFGRYLYPTYNNIFQLLKKFKRLIKN